MVGEKSRAGAEKLLEGLVGLICAFAQIFLLQRPLPTCRSYALSTGVYSGHRDPILFKNYCLCLVAAIAALFCFVTSLYHILRKMSICNLAQSCARSKQMFC